MSAGRLQRYLCRPEVKALWAYEEDKEGKEEEEAAGPSSGLGRTAHRAGADGAAGGEDASGGLAFGYLAAVRGAGVGPVTGRLTAMGRDVSGAVASGGNGDGDGEGKGS